MKSNHLTNRVSRLRHWFDFSGLMSFIRAANVTAEQAISMCQFIDSLAGSLKTHCKSDENRVAVRQRLQPSALSSEEAFDLVIEDCESVIALRIRECILPSWFKVYEHFKPKVARLHEPSLQNFLPWALEVLEEVYRAFALTAEDLRSVPFYLEKDKLEQAKQFRPDLVTRIQTSPVSPAADDKKHLFGRADFTLIADLYQGAAELLPKDHLRPAALERTPSQQIAAASSLIALAAPSRGYVCDRSWRLPDPFKMSDDWALPREEIHAFMRNLMPQHILEPPWLEGRHAWAAVHLCQGTEGAVRFSSLMLKQLEELSLPLLVSHS
jgi:hypothetical protein